MTFTNSMLVVIKIFRLQLCRSDNLLIQVVMKIEIES